MGDDFFPERAFLGSILFGAKFPPGITAEMFSSRKNQIIFNALQNIEGQCVPDIQILVNHLEKTKKLEAAGGAAYIAELTNIVPGPSNIRFYADTLQKQSKERETKRSIKVAAESIIKGKAVETIVPGLMQSLSNHSIPTGRKTSWTAAELLDHEFPPVRWIIPDLVSTGLTILAGAPKLGKSWLALGMSLGVSSGGSILGKIPVEKSGVLYLALEDTGRRLQNRLRMINALPLDNLHFFTEWTSGTAGMTTYLRQHQNIRFVIIDTWGRFARVQDHNDYTETTGRAAELKAIADELDIAIMVIHHTRKGTGISGGDWVDGVLGSQGLSGAADSTIVLRRSRGNRKADLLATGRDITEKELVLSFDVDCGGWTIEGDKVDIQESDARQDILDWIKENGPHTPKQIYEGMKEEGEQRSYATVRGLLSKMTNDGTVINNNGIYLVAYQESTAANPKSSESSLADDRSLSPETPEELDIF